MSGAKWWGNLAIATFSMWSINSSVAWSFSDTSTHWGRACIEQLSQRKLVNGYPNGTFRPNQTVTRAEFAVLMLNAFPNLPRSQRAPTFRDVPTTYWAYRAIQDAAARQLFSGYPDGTFKPTQAIPRVQAIAIATNALNHPAPDQPDAVLRQYFDDAAQVPTYAKRAIAAGTLNRLVVNYPQVKQLRPNQAATRGEVAVLLCQALASSQAELGRTVPSQYIAANQSGFAIPPTAGGFGQFSQGLTVAQKDGRYGYIDTTGKTAIAPRFNVALPFSEGFAAVGVVPDAEGTRWGYIDRQGQWLVEPQFASAKPFSAGLAAVRVGNKVGFIDRTGKFVISPQFDDALPFSEGLAAAQLNQQWGFINPQGQWVIPVQPYGSVAPFSEGLAQVERNNRIGFIDKTGTVVIPLQFAGAQSFAGGLAAVQTPESRWGYIDKSGKLVIPPQFYRAQSFAEGLAGVLIADKWGFINAQGAIAIPAQFYAPQAQAGNGTSVLAEDVAVVSPFSGGLAMARLGNKAGFIDRSGKFAIAPQFADANPFSEGLARVNLGGRWITQTPGPEGPYLTQLEGGEWGYIRAPGR
ncbi:WG repeat-containing protein [Trichocoleus desertorum AS-A10]|uniref:WG repeat-containing protein n=1 Tax=Trichocoleus desertorum TaxID=1481672 RepID=UPI0032967F19